MSDWYGYGHDWQRDQKGPLPPHMVPGHCQASYEGDAAQVPQQRQEMPQQQYPPGYVCNEQYVVQNNYEVPEYGPGERYRSGPPVQYGVRLPPTQFVSPPPPPPPAQQAVAPKGENPREIRNKAEKQRRDKLNQSIAELSSMVPPVAASNRKIDKTGVLRLTAHYLRAHQYVFGDAIGRTATELSAGSVNALMRMFKGFLLTTTYKGVIVVASQNIQQYLGYSELELLGQNVLNIIHEDDRQLVKDSLTPQSNLIGLNGELLIPDGNDGKQTISDILAKDKRQFIVRFKTLTQRTEPNQYITCHVQGTFRRADRACRGYNRCCQMVRRSRSRSDMCCSGNDVVFVGMVRPITETFVKEREIESCRMEYRTRHSVDGEIIQTEHRIALITGYMTHEVRGVNAMNFMHKDDVRWVVIALKEMYVEQRLMGESCYRLITKNGQFIYLQTRGQLEVDHSSGAVTTFVCTNTVLSEEEGKKLSAAMKRKFMLAVSQDDVEEPEHQANDTRIPVEDPKNLEKVIIHLVSNLPSPVPESSQNSPMASSSNASPSTKMALAIIPPKKEQIVSAIEKSYEVMKSFKIIGDIPNGQYKNNVPRQSVLQKNEFAETTHTLETSTYVNMTEHDVSTTYNIEEQYNTDDNNVIKLEPFNEVFVKRNENECTTYISSSPKDQVLASVQLVDEPYMPSTSSNFTGQNQRMKRPNSFDDKLTMNKKVCEESDILNDVTDMKPEEIDLFEDSCLDVLLDDAGLDSQLDAALDMFNSGGDEDYPNPLKGEEVQQILEEVDLSNNDSEEKNGSGNDYKFD